MVCATEAVIEHVPGDTNTTTPDEEPTVHTPVSLLAYDLASVPTDNVLDNVGAEAVITYVEEYDDASIVTVRETLDTT